MKFRIARHATNLQVMVDFYTQNLELEILGGFNNHSDYDGVFLGKKGLDWHLEFTVSSDAPEHHPDEDDLLVFYMPSVEDLERIKANFEANKIPSVKAKNTYWDNYGLTYVDPDGFRVVVVYQEK